MKQPGYLNHKEQVILFSGNEVINKSTFSNHEETFTFQGKDTAYLYLEDFKKEHITLHFLPESKIKLYIILHSSTDTLHQFSYTLEKNAKVDVFTTIRNKGKINVSLHRIFDVSEHATINLQNALCNMGETHINDIVNLNEPYARVDIDQLNVGSYNDQTTVTQEVNHFATYTASNIQNALISNSNAKLTYKVSGSIAKGNEYSSCNQINRGIILKEQGQIEVTPILLIDEYNVEASHGAAIGQVDEEQLYYLLSRGLSELEARSLIISGYTKPFIDSILDEDIQNFIQRQIHKKISEVETHVK